MELIEIEGLFHMDYGAPSPLILSDDNNLSVAFYLNDPGVTELTMRDTIHDTGICIIKFISCFRHSFGIPGNETISGHPYYQLGLLPCGFYELKGSDLIKQLDAIEQIHPKYKADKLQNYKHYILTFHDNMFECVAEGFEIKKETGSLYEQADLMLKDMFKDLI